MDYNELTKEFGGSINKNTSTSSIPLTSSKDLVKEFGGTEGKKSDIYFGNTKVLGGLAANIFSSEKGLGETLGQSLAVNSKDTTEMIKSQQGLSDVQFKVLKEIEAKKQRGEDTTRLESVLNNSNKVKQPTVQEINPATTKTNSQVVGELAGTALDILSAGTYKPLATTLGLAKTAETAAEANKAFQSLGTLGKLKQVGLNTLKRVGISTPFGYGYDVAQNLQEGKTGKEAATPGMGTLFTTVIPLAVGGYQAGKVLAKPTTEYLVGNLSGKGVDAAKQYGSGGQDFSGMTPDEVLKDTRKSLALYDNSVSNAFGATKSDLIKSFTGSRIGLDTTDAVKLRQVATEFGFSDKLPQNLGNMSVKESMDLLGEINSGGRTKIGILDTPAIRTAKYNLSQLKSIVKAKAIKEFGGTGGDFEKAYSSYSKAQKVISDMENVVGSVSKYKTLTPTQLNTAYSRLQRLFTQDSTAYIDAVKSFESVTGERILDKVAASQFSDIVPKALKTGDKSMYAVANDLFSLLTFPLSSPKLGSHLISLTSGYKPSVVSKLLSASPQIRKIVYDSVINENTSLDEAMKKALVEYEKIPNKQGGFISGSTNQSLKESLNSTKPANIQDKATTAMKSNPKKDTISKNNVTIPKTIPQKNINASIPVNNINEQIFNNLDELQTSVESTSKGSINLDDIEFLDSLRNLKTSDLNYKDRIRFYEIAAKNGRQDIVDNINKIVSTKK